MNVLKRLNSCITLPQKSLLGEVEKTGQRVKLTIENNCDKPQPGNHKLY